MAATTLLNAVTTDTTATPFDVSGYRSVTLVVSGTWGGQTGVYVTGDSGDGNYGDVSITKSGSRNLVNTINSNGRYEVDTTGTANLLVRGIPASGNITVKVLGTDATSAGAATGTAGTPNAAVVSVQGVSGGTAVKVDGSAVTQPVEQQTYTAPAIAQVTSGTSSAQFSSVPCKFARFKALAVNTGKCYIGVATGVTTGTGFELQAGDDTGWIPVDNISRFWHIADTASQKIAYLVLI
jgi:hypothetical protein